MTGAFLPGCHGADSDWDKICPPNVVIANKQCG